MRVLSRLFLMGLFLPAAALAECPADPGWLPATPRLVSTSAPPRHPAPDCPFYQSAWQTMLAATQPDSNGQPAFIRDYSTIADLFSPEVAVGFATRKTGLLSLAPRSLQRPNEKLPSEKLKAPAISAGVNQAGTLRGLLIDQNGNPIFYAIHVNDVFAQFIRQNKLTTRDALINADPEALQFPTGAIELKSAWQIVEGAAAPANYFTTRALVPLLEIKNGDIVLSSSNREVTVALLAIHVVFVLKDHPEFIWSTFEHVGADGQGLRDNAPVAPSNPKSVATGTLISQADWTLYRAGTASDKANIPNTAQDRINTFDASLQKFSKGGKTLQTSVYRSFPASKVDGVDEDGDVSAVNKSMAQLFAAKTPGAFDRRRNYQLVGAVWLDDPTKFKSGMLFQNKDDESTDAPGAMLAGEGALSSTAMESFTQIDQQNCFSCHNTKRVTDDLTGKQIMAAKRLNVSHVLSKFLSESQ